MDEVWLVMGSAGDYDDFAEWVVCAYPAQEMAIEHARRAQARTNRLIHVMNLLRGYDNSWYRNRKYIERGRVKGDANPYDPQMVSLRSDTSYGVVSVPFRNFVGAL